MILEEGLERSKDNLSNSAWYSSMPQCPKNLQEEWIIIELEKIAIQEFGKNPQLDATIQNSSTKKYNTRWKHWARNTEFLAREINVELSRSRKRVFEDSSSFSSSMFVKEIATCSSKKKIKI